MITSDIKKVYPELNEILAEVPDYIKQQCFIIEYQPESFILRKGDALEYVFLLLRGTVDIINEFEEGDSFHFAQVNSLDIIGEIEFLASEQLVASTCMAASKCITLQIPLNILERWINEDKIFFRFITTALAKKNFEASINRGIELMYPT